MILRSLVARNLRLYFRDRLNVFFSLLAALILFLLYTLFLGNLQTDGMAAQFPNASDRTIKAMVDTWMFAGIVGITTITTGLGALSTLVEDASSGRFRDFLVSPVRRSQLVLGYLVSTFVVSIAMTLVILVIALVYLGVVDGVTLGPVQILRTIAWIALSCVAFASLAAFGVSFIRSPGAFSALSTIVGTILGFLAGAYIPVGSLPDGVAGVINALPFNQASMLLRQEFTATTIDSLAGSSQAADALREFYGVTAVVGDWVVPVGYVVAVLLAMVVVFTTLAALRIRRIIR